MKQAGFRTEEVGWQEVSLYKSKYQLGCIYALRNYFFKREMSFFKYIHFFAKQQAIKGMLLVKMSVSQLIKILSETLVTIACLTTFVCKCAFHWTTKLVRAFCCYYFIISFSLDIWHSVFFFPANEGVTAFG